MIQWKLCFLLLLLPCLGCNTEEAIVKSPWREPYVTQVCSNDTLNIITLIVCKVRTKKSEGEVCRLLYQHGQDLKYECGSRFRFMTENQTVFLQLTSLTPDDSGNLTCKCSHAIGTNTDHLNNTMEDTVQGQDHLDYLYVEPLWTKMNQMNTTQVLSSQQVMSTRMSPQCSANVIERQIQPTTLPREKWMEEKLITQLKSMKTSKSRVNAV
ncbi:uncharacterized protein LOC113164261 isoform X4 [Anabas testudineus]|uniref:uncharacterized protein LOC113164261 isoform X4 n=1 Tax=Anabas testudineus TaxID=64144 RepID=UPI000E45B14B|nr:uncharacterized protein LOC113164261 isoform X4 [Anabas testudineus]